MKRVVVISPCRGNWIRRRLNRAYARLAVRDCLMRGEAPIAGHLTYAHPVILRDHIEAERKMGMEAGQAWIEVADEVVVYADYGISDGMARDIGVAHLAEKPVEFRHILAEAHSGESFAKFLAGF